MVVLGKRNHEGASCNVRLAAVPLSLKGSVLEINDLKTEPGMRGRGLATKLVAKICKEADLAKKLLILIADNVSLEKWYNKHGFERIQDSPILMLREPK